MNVFCFLSTLTRRTFNLFLMQGDSKVDNLFRFRDTKKNKKLLFSFFLFSRAKISQVTHSESIAIFYSNKIREREVINRVKKTEVEGYTANPQKILVIFIIFLNTKTILLTRPLSLIFDCGSSVISWNWIILNALKLSCEAEKHSLDNVFWKIYAILHLGFSFLGSRFNFFTNALVSSQKLTLSTTLNFNLKLLICLDVIYKKCFVKCYLKKNTATN